MLDIVPTRSGHSTISCNGRFLHSTYNPLKEAFRYLESFDLTDTAVCLLLEPCVDYLAEAIHTRFPGIRVISLHCRDELKPLVKSSAPSHFPSDDKSLFSFLSEHIEDSQLSGTSIIEWEPSALVFGEDYTMLSRSVYNYFRIRNSTIQTVGMFGRLWLSNRISSFLDLSFLAAPFSETRPVIIICPGPSLESVLPLISRHRDTFALWSLSSALATLTEFSITPDLIFHTDAGYYARYHIRSLFSHDFTSKNAPPIAAPLTAGIDHGIDKKRNKEIVGGREQAKVPGESSIYPRLPVLSESAIENYLIHDFGLPYMRLPSHGTVAGTAYHAALAYSGERVFFAGLDLAHRDIKTHASGHTFSNFFLASADRYNPLHTIYFSRSSKQNNALYTYTQWFAIQKKQERFFRINPSPTKLPNFKPIYTKEFSDYAASIPHSPRKKKHIKRISCFPAPSLERRRVHIEKLVSILRKKSRQLKLRNNASETIDILRKDPLLSELASESNMAAFLRLYRDSSSEALAGIIESIDCTLNNWEAMLQAYGQE
ncbi:MAG: 6-hydroxymethylpterin diphosphokinase MptE-like protein [Spirochaetia bacterium]